VGTIIDARRGAVELTTALPHGRRQAATVRGGEFEVRQGASGGGMTDLILEGGDFSACSRASGHGGHVARAAQAGPRVKSSRVVRSIWVADHHGHFRTHGQNSVATVRGTNWLTADRCDGTLTRVKQGKVSVRANHKRRGVLVTAGHAYLARAPRAH
jgi:hypothetical protein